MKYTSYDAYAAVHKALTDEQGVAGKRLDDARHALKYALDTEQGAGELAQRTEAVTKALAAQEDMSKALALLKNENPALEQSRLDDEKNQELTLAKLGNASLDGATLNLTGKLVEQGSLAIDAANAAGLTTAEGIPALKGLDKAFPPGSVIDNAVVGVKLFGAELAAAAARIMGGASAPDEHATAHGIGAPTERQSVAGAVLPPDRGLPGNAPGFAAYRAAVSDAIAAGDDVKKAEETAARAFHEDLTGKRFDKADGLAEALAKELESRHGEEARKQFEATRGVAMEAQAQEIQRTAGLAGHVA